MEKHETMDSKGETFMEILMIDYRWVLACFFLLPMSFLFNLWFYLRNIIIFQLNSAPQTHDKKVHEVQRQVF